MIREDAERRCGPHTLDELSGRVVEYSGWNQSACISLAVPLIRECRQRRRGGAWIASKDLEGASLFFPPDFERAGIDCSRLPIIWSDSPADSFGIAERIIRSGGFGIAVLDLTAGRRIPGGAVGRLYSLVRKFESLALCLTRSAPGAPSLDPMIFIHAHVHAIPAGDGRFELSIRIQKDKAGAPRRRRLGLYEPPIGLC